MWLALMATTGKQVWVNFDRVIFFGEMEKGSVLSFGKEDAILVKETPVEVMILLAEYEDGEEPDESPPGGKHAYGGVYN